MTTREMYILLNHAEINGNLCSADGQLCYIAPNYIQIFDKEITDIPDANTNCHMLAIPASDVKEVKNGSALEYFLWKGPHGGRYNEGDKSTLPISNASKHGIKKSHVPLAVQFASLVIELGEEALDEWPNMGESSIKEWIDKSASILSDHSAST